MREERSSADQTSAQEDAHVLHDWLNEHIAVAFVLLIVVLAIFSYVVSLANI
jgi:hypothetical protein